MTRSRSSGSVGSNVSPLERVVTASNTQEDKQPVMTDFRRYVERTKAFDAAYDPSNASETAIYPGMSRGNADIDGMESSKTSEKKKEGGRTATAAEYPGVSVRTLFGDRRNAYVEWMRSKEARRNEDKRDTAATAEYSKYRTVLSRLRAWHEWDKARRKSLTSFILSSLGLRRRPLCPSEDELFDLALFHFPLQRELKARVSDFGPEKVFTFEQSLDEIQKVWVTKPDWAIIRWIHIPVGPGLLAASLEDIFMNDASDAATTDYGYGDHPLSRFEVLSFRNRQYLRDQIDVFNILKHFGRLSDRLTARQALTSHNSVMMENMQWRSEHFGERLDFWNLARADLPSQLTEGTYGDYEMLDSLQAAEVDEQFLSRHSAYAGAVLVRDVFRSFNRGDGHLLTLSPMTGIDYLDKNFPQALAQSPRDRPYDDDHYILDHILQHWLYHPMDTSDPSYKTADRLLLDIFARLQSSPTNQRAGGNMPDIQNAYIPVVRALRSGGRQQDSVQLVREYVACMNEITQIHETVEQRLASLESLLENEKMFQGLSTESTSMMTEEIQWAIRLNTKSYANMPRLVKDLKASLDVIFQLRTIEQNEIAIKAEINNKAIIVFTIVTIVFLPLSFFTSYFGMNLQGVVNTNRTERYFWAVCGTATVCVVSLTVLFGFKTRLHDWAAKQVGIRP